MRTSLWFTTLCSLILSFVFVGCDDDQDADVVTVVAVMPFTGAFAAKGELHVNAIRMAVDRLEKDGITDHIGKAFKIELVNSGVSEKIRITEDVARLIESKNVAAVISSTGDAHEYALFPALAANIPFFEISDGAHHFEFIDTDHEAKLGQPRDAFDESYAFSPRALCYTLADVAGRYIVDNHKGKKLALMRGEQTHDIMHLNTVRAIVTDYNNGLQELADEEQANGNNQEAEEILSEQVEIVNTVEEELDNRYFLSREVGAFDLEIANIISDFDPDVIFYHLRGDAFNKKYLRDAASAGFDDGIRTVDGVREKVLVTCSMAQNDGVVDNNLNGGINDYLNRRLFYITRRPPPTEKLSAFREEYEAQWGAASDTFAPGGYDTMNLIGLGLAKIGLAADGTIDTLALKEAIASVARPEGTVVEYNNLAPAAAIFESGGDINYEGATGSMDFSAALTIKGEYALETVDGENSAFLRIPDWASDGNSVIIDDSFDLAE